MFPSALKLRFRSCQVMACETELNPPIRGFLTQLGVAIPLAISYPVTVLHVQMMETAVQKLRSAGPVPSPRTGTLLLASL